MGNLWTRQRSQRSSTGLPQQCAVSDLIAPELRPSQYQQRVAQLAREPIEVDESLESTLRRAIDFCYGGGVDWAPHVRVTVYADNPVEHQSNVPVLSTLLCAWGRPLPEDPNPRCRAVEGTDVNRGCVVTSPFWERTVSISNQLGHINHVPYRDLVHRLLYQFLALPEEDVRKQLLVNIVLQLHEACYNCIGRHKEVFEFCVYDLIDSEFQGVPPVVPESLEGYQRVVRRHAGRFLDRYKRDALHATVISPLKFIYQNMYMVFENLDSHGASFWAAVFTLVFFPGLEMPYESIVELDKGWTWAAVDFLSMMQHGDAKIALDRFAAPKNVGQDWRRLSRGLVAPQRPQRLFLPGLPWQFDESGFQVALTAAKRRGSQLNRTLLPYAHRFASIMALPGLLERCALSALGAVDWDTALGPALAALSAEALGTALTPTGVRERLLSGGDASDAGALCVDTEAFAALLRSAGVAWAQLPAAFQSSTGL